MRIGKHSLSTIILGGLLLLAILFYNLFDTTVSGDGPSIYVSHHGSDSSGDGSETNPFRSLDRAAETAVPGSTILVRGGTYNHTKATITAHGTANEPITIRPFPGEHVVFDGQDANIGNAESIIKISHASHLIFEGFEIRNSAARGLSVYESEHIIVRQNRIHETIERGLGGGGHHLLFEGNEVWRASLENENEAFNAGGGWKAGLSTYKLANGQPSSHITIRNNYIHDNWGEGIIAIFAEDVVIEGNKLHDNYSVNIYLDNAHNVTVQRNHLYTTSDTYNRRDKGYPAHGIHMANEQYSAPTNTQLSNVTIANNLIVGTGRGISFWQDSSNSSRDNSYQGIAIVYNVVQATHDHAIWFDSVGDGFAQPQGNRLHNNIIFTGQNGRLLDIGNSDGWQFSHNNWPDGIPSLADEPNSFAAQPHFINPDPQGAALGYQLQAGDRSIQAGLAFAHVSSDFWGKTRDAARPSLGIHEFGEAAEPPEEPTATTEPTATSEPTATTEPTATSEPTATTEPTTITPTATITATQPTITPTATITTPLPTVMPTVTITAPLPTETPAPTAQLYLSTSSGGDIGDLEFDDEDVLAFDMVAGTWQLYFDGSDVGLRRDIDALAVLPDGRFLLSLDKATDVPELGRVEDADLILFLPTSTGPDTNGRFAWFFDGSDVGLASGDEDIDGVTLLPNGRLLISTASSFEVAGVNGEIEGKDEDLLLFTPSSLGENTAGQWELYFDGSDVGLGDEDIWGVWLEPFSHTLYLSAKNSFELGNLAISSRDIFACRPQQLGPDTSCTFAPTLFWDGRANGLDRRLDAISLPIALGEETAVMTRYLAQFPPAK